MKNGPLINNIKTKEAFRSSLGIEETINTMQSELCQAINNNTSYAYYFALIIWCYIDYEKNNDPSQYSYSGANSYLKKQNFFFSLAHILNNRLIVGAIGSNHIIGQMDLKKESFLYEENYLQSMQSLDYYLPGLDKLMLLKTETLEGNKLNHPTVTEYGKQLGLVFEQTINKTVYYTEYRLSDKPVPKDVLLELANTISIDLINNSELKQILRNIFFNNTYANFKDGMYDTKDYILFVNSKYGIDVVNNNLRNVLYDYFSPRGYNYPYPEELNDIIKKWELVTARRYFTVGLGIIWKYILPLIEEPKTFSKWVEKTINHYDFDFNLDDKLENIIDSIEMNYETREEIINKARKDGFTDKEAVCNGFKLLLSIYKRFDDRKDITKDHNYIINSEWDSLPLSGFFDVVKNHLNKPIHEFIEYIIMNYLVLQNERTAYRKLVNENKDGYHFEKISDQYILSRHYYINMGNDRINALAGILEQLNMLEGDSNAR